MLYYHCVRDISWSLFFSTREMNVAVLVDGFQTCFGSAASAFENIEWAYIHYALKENLSVTMKGFSLHVFHWSVENYLCSRSQPNTKYKSWQLIRFTWRTETMTDLKNVAPTKQPLRCKANYQRRIYYSIALKGAQFSTAATNKI